MTREPSPPLASGRTPLAYRLLIILLVAAGTPPAPSQAEEKRPEVMPSPHATRRLPAQPPRQEFFLPTALPSGIPVNDRVWVTFYPAAPANEQPAPAVVLLHALGETRMKVMDEFGRYLARHGIGAAVMELPYHMRRRPPGYGSAGPFVDPSVDRMVQAASQATSDVTTVVSWLSQQPSVDPHRIGVVGISLGAMIAHLAMGLDSRLGAGVAILGGGDLSDLRRTSLVFRFRKHFPRGKLTPEEREELERVDPLHHADRNRPRRVLMIEAARDLLMPPRDARALWNALGRPPILWVDTNHFGLGLSIRSVLRTSTAYLWSVWNGAPADAAALPAIHAVTLKLGLITGLGAHATPALQWQAFTFLTRRNHMSLLHADLGWSGVGPFAGLAVTLNGFMDLGLGHRFNGGGIRPYLSLHLVF